ncbi:hypothetical protein BDZ85DRAFT_283404 [Elsinoe ampelina]|uniref:Uncharacterized protein n=1 Tax=Elsinoe ampelina TaxID=302913 RepID=A0A6A6G6D4_9PEZI|nr:hypothetical protein BDZ85DRAFT_283404 [Elsinoe ampelina]
MANANTPLMREPALTAPNQHDRLEAEMRHLGQTTWGFVIYRCTFASNDDWEKVMAKLKQQDMTLDEWPSYALKPHLRDGLKYTVFEDRALDGATKEQVLEQFKGWLDTEPWRSEQPLSDKTIRLAARYDICLMIDEASLKSILDVRLQGGRDDEEVSIGYVYALRYEANSPPDPDENYWWMRISFDDLSIRWYDLLSRDGWHNEHKQHPDIALG